LYVHLTLCISYRLLGILKLRRKMAFEFKLQRSTEKCDEKLALSEMEEKEERKIHVERNVSCATVVRTQGSINPTRAHCVRTSHPPQKPPLSISLLSNGFPIQRPDISNVGFTAGPFERRAR
jgi:hypothetical protein